MVVAMLVTALQLLEWKRCDKERQWLWWWQGKTCRCSTKWQPLVFTPPALWSQYSYVDDVANLKQDLQMVLTLNFVDDENQHNTQRLYWPRILQVLHELTGTDELYVDCEVVNRDDHCLVVESWWSLWSGQYWWSLCQYYSGHHGWDYFIMYWIFLLSFLSALLNSSW